MRFWLILSRRSNQIPISFVIAYTQRDGLCPQVTGRHLSPVIFNAYGARGRDISFKYAGCVAQSLCDAACGARM